MKDSIREINEIPELTMGLDLGDKFSARKHPKQGLRSAAKVTVTVKAPCSEVRCSPRAPN